MQTQAWRPDRAAVAVIRRIRDALQIERGEEAGEQLSAVIAFPRDFRSVAKRAIADEEVEPTFRQILGVDGGDSARDYSGRHSVVRPFPACSGDRDSPFGQTVDCGEGEALGLAVIPSEPHESSDVFCDLLLCVHTESVLKGSRPARSRYVRCAAGLGGERDRIAVCAGLRMVQIFEYAH